MKNLYGGFSKFFIWYIIEVDKLDFLQEVNDMKVYEFERLQIWGMVISESTEHRLIINKYASEGYRYVGYIPVVIGSDGRLMSIDLVFEKDC